jgi:hypothetical protein
MLGTCGSADFGKPTAIIIQQLPTAEFLLVDLFLGAAHTRRKSETVSQYM